MLTNQSQAVSAIISVAAELGKRQLKNGTAPGLQVERLLLLLQTLFEPRLPIIALARKTSTITGLKYNPAKTFTPPIGTAKPTISAQQMLLVS